MNRLFGVFLVLSVLGFPSGRQAFAENLTLTLEEAVRLALVHSPDALMAKAQTRQAEAALRETRAIDLPRAVVGTGAAYNNGFPLSIEGAAPSIFRFEAIHPLFNAQNKNLIREAGESVKAVRIGGDIVDNELAAQTASVYFRLDQARKIAALNESVLAETQKRREFLEIDVEAGRARPVDAALLKTEIAAANQEILIAREQALLAEAELRELTGLDGAVSIRTITPAMESPVYGMDAAALFEKTAASSPEIMRAEAKIRAKEFHVAAEKAERYPRIAVVGEYGMFSKSNNYEDYYNRFERNNYLIGVSAQLSLFDGSRSKARVAQSREELSMEQLDLRRLKSDMKRNIQKGLSDLRIARGAVDVAAAGLEAAEEMVEINEILFESGRAGEREMTEARLNARRKELAKLDAEQNLFERKVELLRVTGSILTVF
ncbi:MAG: TolC family protein [Acidobacteriota bacterium]|jgi:outer membrane protein TolC|nr:TolC family protein [Acidobacteriota bacterium]